MQFAPDGGLNTPASPVQRRRDRGFTIIEVGVAAGVLALCITTAITVMQRGFASLDSARNMTQATQIIQTEIEKMRMQTWATVNAYSSTATTVTIDSAYSGNTALTGRNFSVTRTATDVSGYTLSGMKQIVFTASWRNYDGRTITRSVTTYYGQNGLYDYYYNQN